MIEHIFGIVTGILFAGMAVYEIFLIVRTLWLFLRNDAKEHDSETGGLVYLNFFAGILLVASTLITIKISSMAFKGELKMVLDKMLFTFANL